MVKNELLFIGDKDGVRSIHDATWKAPGFYGSLMIIMFMVYEFISIGVRMTSNMVVYFDYPLKVIHDLLLDVTISIIIAIMLGMMLGLLALLSSSRLASVSIERVVLAMVITVLLLATTCGVLRFAADALLLGCVPEPVDAWIFRCYSDSLVLLFEFKVIPDLVISGFLVIGSCLILLTSLSYNSKLLSVTTVFKKGKPSGDESISMNGKELKVKCKELGDVKACKI
jgi:hypothetical protein